MIVPSRTFRVTAVVAAVALMAILLSLLTVAKPGQAAFPGSNGAIAFTSNQDGELEIYRMAPDGFGGVYSAKLTDNSDTDNLPAWNAEAPGSPS